LNYRWVTFSNTKIKDLDACDEFFKLAVISYILTAAMELLDMTHVDDQPSLTVIKEDDWLQAEDGRDILYALASSVVKRYVDLNYKAINVSTESDKKMEYSRLLLSIGILYL
jgi:hypothetical protein